MKLTAEQRSVLSDFLAEARRRGASPKETKALIEAGLVEANLGNPRYGDRDSLGSLQQRPSQGWGSAAQVLNPRYAASKFLSSAKQANRPGISAGQLAQAVQRSAFPSRYQERSGQAESLLSGRRSGSTTTTTTTTPGVDRSAQRQALLLSYLDQRNNPDALLNLASGLQGAQDTPGSTKTVRNTQPGGGTDVQRIKAEAQHINDAHVPYQWGGGHGGKQSPGSTVTPLDCSGAVSRALGINPRVSGQFMNWGKPGRGKGVTIYANAHHVLLEINGHFWGTSRSNPGGGAGWIPRGAISKSYLAQFTARHPAGG